jgi:hypothetical protein
VRVSADLDVGPGDAQNPVAADGQTLSLRWVWARSRTEYRQAGTRMSELARSIAMLYEAFREYPLNARIEACPHCELESAKACLHTRPLRELGWAELGVYTFKAMTTFGDAIDFKHFLPRILELYVLDHRGAQYDVSVVFEKLNYASWQSWPDSEVAAVRHFVAAWRWALAAAQQDSGRECWKLGELEAALLESRFEEGARQPRAAPDVGVR